MVADSAGGYAAFSLMPDDATGLAVEYKINLFAPAAGREFVAKAHVVRAGRTISVASADVHAIDECGASECVAVMQATMMRVEASPDIRA